MNPKSIRYHSLRVEDYSCLVRLGCMAEERAQPQEVRFTLEFRFAQAPKGTATDELTDTICYAEVTSVLREHCASGEFKLIERLATEAFVKVKSKLSPEVELALKLHKVKPPVEKLYGGSIYVCGDFQL